MKKDFETIVMNTYAELCVMWRIAHVANRDQAEEYNEKLTSLEAVIVAFNLATPDTAESETLPPRSAQIEPLPRAQNSPNSLPREESMILQE